MKESKVKTPEDYMLSLNWDYDALQKAIIFLLDWDTRDDKYYKSMKASKVVQKVDLCEREHYRNCINFWKKRLGVVEN
jgi:hypothetical protein